jgi:guanylate cyclase
VFPDIAHLPVGNAILVSAGLVVTAGGLVASGVNSVWGFVAVLGALAIFGDRRATFWLFAFIASQIIAIGWATQVDPLYHLENLEYVVAFNLLVVVVFTYFILLYYARQRAVLLERSDRLLRNVLPDDIANRLQESSDTIADNYQATSILFADVVDFTPLSSGMSPEDLVALLDEVFTAFDSLVEERGLEKIKTIGDAYMVAAGVPKERPDHAQILCDLGLAILALVTSREFNKQQIRMRIGINSGPVVAGIIGTKKFSYDLWGDAVNTASRMESTGTPGKIHITQTTQRLVRDEFVCEPLTPIDVKGKGPTAVWSLEGRK